MHTQRHEIVLFSLTLLSLLITGVHSQSPSPAASPSDFIRTSCSTTYYPGICFTSLSRYAAKVNHDPIRLTHTALVVALSSTRRAASYISTVSDPRSAVAIKDCASLLDSASFDLFKSLRQMKRMAAAGSQSAAFRNWVSDVRTWLTAASMDDGSCKEAFDVLERSGSGSATVKEEVIRRFHEVTKITSNVLSLFVRNYCPN